jgi:multiple sugar transport system substrate-binding protein
VQRKLWVWSVAVILVLSIFLVGCGKKKEAVNSEGKKKITYMYAGGTANDVIVKKATKLFNEKHPEIEVELIYVPNWGTYIDKITTSLASNTAPDIIALGVYQIGDFVRKNALFDLKDYINKDQEFQEQKKDIFPVTLWDSITFEDGIYGIPAWQNPDVMYYNKKLFDEAGVSYPDKSWDYERYVQESLKLTKRENGKVTQFGTWGLGWYWNYLWAYGAEALNKDGTKCLLDKPEAIAAFQYMIDLYQKHHVAPRPSETGDQQNYQAFMTGKVATFVSGRYMVPMLRDIKEFDWDIAVLPHGKKRETLNNNIYWLVLNSSKAPDTAWEYVKFLSGLEVQRLISESENDVPVLKSVMESKSFMNPDAAPNEQVYIDALQSSRPFPITMDMRIDSMVSDTIQTINLGKKTVKQALIELTKQVNQHLQER